MSISKRVTKYWDTYDTSSIGVGAYTDEHLFNKYIQGDILEVGCGRGGRIGKINSFKTKTGIDPSTQAINDAKKHSPETNFVVGIAEKLPFPDDSFDFVYSLEVFEHVKQYELMVSEMVRVLRGNGIGYIQTPNYPAKRFYDFAYWLLRRRSDFKDDYTHVTKMSTFTLSKVISNHANVEYVSTRNILGGNFFPLNYLDKSSFLAKIIGQKSIVIFSKRG